MYASHRGGTEDGPEEKAESGEEERGTSEPWEQRGVSRRGFMAGSVCFWRVRGHAGFVSLQPRPGARDRRKEVVIPTTDGWAAALRPSGSWCARETGSQDRVTICGTGGAENTLSWGNVAIGDGAGGG